MEPVAHFETPLGTTCPVFDPADLESAPIQFKLNGQTVAFMFTSDTAAATNPEIRFKLGGTTHAATGVNPDADPSYDVQSIVSDDPEAGTAYTVESDIYNASAGTGSETIEYRVNGATYDTTTVDIDPYQTETVTFSPTAPDTAGSYTHGVYTNADSRTGTLSVSGSATLEPTAITPEQLTVTEGNTISVDGTIENTGNAAGSGEARYHVDDRHADTETTATLDPGQSETLTFSTTAAEDPGAYTHSVTTDDGMVAGDLTIEPEYTLVDDYGHDQLAAYYQGGTGGHATTTSWSEVGGRSLYPTNTNSSWMRSFPQGNSFRDHSTSLDYYPQRGDTIRVVCRVNSYNDTGYNAQGHLFRFKFNCGAISNDFNYQHHMGLENPWHELTDRYTSATQQANVSETFQAGDVIEYVFDWQSDDTVTIWIERDGQVLDGQFSMNVSPPGGDAGFGISLRDDGGDTMYVSHVLVE